MAPIEITIQFRGARSVATCQPDPDRKPIKRTRKTGALVANSMVSALSRRKLDGREYAVIGAGLRGVVPPWQR